MKSLIDEINKLGADIEDEVYRTEKDANIQFQKILGKYFERL